MRPVKHKCGHHVATVAMCFLVRCSAEVNKARFSGSGYTRVYACCHGSQSAPVEKLPPLPQLEKSQLLRVASNRWTR